MVLPGSPAEAETSTAVLTRTGRRRGRDGAVGWSTWSVFAVLSVGLFGMPAWGAEETHTVPYVPSASSEGRAGVVRIESRSAVPGEVRIMAVDDAGQRLEAGRLTLGAKAAVEFEIDALESGNTSLGLTGTGPGEGDWRLELTTELDIEARAYARSEGFLTALHDAALVAGEVELPLFHPGGDARRSVLRLANAGGERATVAVRGVDDAGRAGGPMTVELAAWEARGYTAAELESGSAAGLSGSLGDGIGKWRLFLEAERGSAYATNLLLDGSVLSSVPGGMSRGPGGLHRVPLFPSASDGAGRRGVVRVVNRSPESAQVEIDAFDATDRAYERLRLSLGGHSSEQFDSTDLEQGSSEKGLEGSTGSGEGDWWLELTSGSDIEVLSCVDAATGPLSALRGTAGVETDAGLRYEAVLLSGAGELRLLNAGGAEVEVRVSGTHDTGAPGGAAELTLAPWASRTLTREALEEGEAGLRGALGAGTGSWRLRLEADGEIDVLSLVRGAGGMLSDVSRRGRPAGAPPRTDVIDAAVSRADLRVAASASAAELSPGEAFDLAATVGNVGDREASATTLRYYRSADAVIATGDTEVGTDPVAALAAAQSIARSLSLVAPTAPGTYRYGACVDTVAEETNTANNCSAAVAVTVREPPRRPDLAVTATLSDAALEPGESFSLNAAVRNRGGAGASATTLRYRRSADATITTTDTRVGTDAVAALAASETSAESVRLTAPTTAGTYYYGACVDPVEGESNATDNCSSPVRLDVAEPAAADPAPDLEVGAPTVDDASLAPGESFTLSATVRNAGDGAAAATTLRYHRSADATITTSDTRMGTDAVAALAASGSSAESIALTAPTTAGTYYYGACVDAVEGESNATDNCSSPVRLDVSEPTVPDPAPDLEVGAPTVDDASLAPGESFTLSATVRNAGDGAAAATTLRYRRSAAATISTTDAQVGTDAVAALAASGSSAESVRLTAPTTSGTYYYGACVDAVEGESDATDNCSSPVRLDVAEPTVPDPAPDLEVGAPTVDDASLEPGESFTLSATVANAGDGAAAATTLRYYRSENVAIATSDTEVGAAGVPALAAGGVETRSLELTAPPTAGTYHYGACVDAVPEESATANNCSSAVTVTVREPTLRPDLAVVSVSGPESVFPGERIRLRATVRSVGAADAPKTWIGLYFSEDAAVSPSDDNVGYYGFSAMAVGDTRTFQWRLVTVPTEVGTYYYGACVNAVPHESDTSNNCSTVAVTTIPPDLAVVASGPAESVFPGERITLRATVRNVGAVSAPSTRVGLYRSEDAAVSPSDHRLRKENVSAMAVGDTRTFQWHWVTVPTEVGTHYYGACVNAVPHESDTSNNCSTVAVTVREPSGQPDLTIVASSSGPCELSATVSNVGTERSMFTRLTWHRVGGTSIRRWDLLPIHPGQGVTKSHGFNSGSYYGCVDAPPYETVTDNNCSETVEVTAHSR